MATLANAPRSTSITLGSASAGPFDIGYRLFFDRVKVFLDGIETDEFTLASTFLDGYADDGTVTLNSAAPAGTVVRIDSHHIPTRADDYINGDPGLTRKLNIELGQLWGALADVRRDARWSLRGTTLQRPLAESDADGVLMWKGLDFKIGPTVEDIEGWYAGAQAARDLAQQYADQAAAAAHANGIAVPFSDTFTGNGITTTFALSRDPISVLFLDVSISGVTQVAGADYALVNHVPAASGKGIKFTTAPISGEPICVRGIAPVSIYDADAVVMSNGDTLQQFADDAETRLTLIEGTPSSLPTRADLVAKRGDYAVGDVVNVGGLFYRYAGSGTAIADLPGWVPDGAVYVDHFAANTTPGTTDMAAAIMAAHSYARPLGKIVNFKHDGVYRFNSTLRISSGGSFFRGDGDNSQAAQLQYGGASGSPAIWYGPTDAENPATAMISNARFENLSLVKIGAASSSYGFFGQKVSGVRIVNCVSQGFWKNYRHEGCYNVFMEDAVGFAANFDGLTSNGAIYSIDSVALTNGERFNGFTHFIGGRLSSGQNSGDGLVRYRCTVEVADNDYLHINDLYWGFAKTHVLIRPSSTKAKIYNVRLADCYMDFSGSDTAPTVIEYDFNGLTLESSAGVAYLQVDNCIFNASKHVLHIKAGAKPQGPLLVSNTDIHSTRDVPVLVEDTASSPVNLVWSNNGVWLWSRDHLASPAVRVTKPAISIARASSVQISNSRFLAEQSDIPWLIASNVTNLTQSGNVVTSAAGAQLSAIGSYEGDGGLGDGLTRGSFTPSLTFGGASTGITYASRFGEWRRDGNRVTVSLYVALSSKGTATGDAKISLPFPSLTGRAGPLQITHGPIPASTIETFAIPQDGQAEALMRRTDTTGGISTITDVHFSGTTFFWINGTYIVQPF